MSWRFEELCVLPMRFASFYSGDQSSVTRDTCEWV